MKKYMLGLFAVVLAVAFSAFTVAKVKVTPSNSGKLTTTYYFRYIPTSAFGETDYEADANWDFIGTSAGSNTCGGETDPCVIHAALADGLSTEEAAVTALTNFLKAETSAETYCETPGNITYKKN